MANLFYADACIYLNLWKMEGNEKFGAPYWQIAKDFFEKFSSKDSFIYYSNFLIKELSFALTKEQFDKKKLLFCDSKNFRKVHISQEEISMARKIESELDYSPSFYDILHMLLAKKSNSILVTRDKNLLDASKKYNIEAKRPEELL